jgi:hypothetical protein
VLLKASKFVRHAWTAPTSFYKHIYSQRETEEKARQPETKLSAIAQTRHIARLRDAKRSRTRNPKPTHGARDRPKQSQPRAGRDRASEPSRRHASRRTRPTDTGTRCPGKGQRVFIRVFINTCCLIARPRDGLFGCRGHVSVQLLRKSFPICDCVVPQTGLGPLHDLVGSTPNHHHSKGPSSGCFGQQTGAIEDLLSLTCYGLTGRRRLMRSTT